MRLPFCSGLICTLVKFAEFVAKILLSSLELAGVTDVGNHQKMAVDKEKIVAILSVDVGRPMSCVNNLHNDKVQRT